MKTQIIEVPSDGSKVDKEIITEFNNVYKTNFKIVGNEDRDGVEFVFIDAGANNLNMIYQLAFFHGLKIQKRRMTNGL